MTRLRFGTGGSEGAVREPSNAVDGCFVSAPLWDDLFAEDEAGESKTAGVLSTLILFATSVCAIFMPPVAALVLVLCFGVSQSSSALRFFDTTWVWADWSPYRDVERRVRGPTSRPSNVFKESSLRGLPGGRLMLSLVSMLKQRVFEVCAYVVSGESLSSSSSSAA